MFENISEKMFDNIGEKIKTVSKVLCWLGIIASIIWCIILFFSGKEESGIVSIIVLIGGCLASWVGSFYIYGFGELISNSQIIADNTSILSTHNTSHVWRCKKCGQLTRTNPCSCCGYNSSDS